MIRIITSICAEISGHLFALAVLLSFPAPGAATPVQDATALQKQAIERIQRCIAQIRKTGDPQASLEEMRLAEDELSRSYQEFIRRGDNAAASLSLHKGADLQRLQYRWRQADDLYRQAYELARKANNAAYQAKTLIGRARVANNGLKNYDAAIGYLDESIRLSEQGGDKRDLFDAYDLKSAALSSRGELAAAFDFANRAFSLATETNDPELLFYAYFGRGSIYQSLGLSCDDKRVARQCVEALGRAKTDLEQALGLAHKQGYEYFAKFLTDMLKENRLRLELVQMSDRHARTLASINIFDPSKPSDVVVNDNFFSPPDPFPPLIESFAREEIKRSNLNENAIGNHTQAILLYSQGQVEAALKSFLKAAELLESDLQKLSDESGRSAFVEDKMELFYFPILLLLQLRRYSEAFELMERSRSRALADLLQSQEIKLAQPGDRAIYSEIVNLNSQISRLRKDLLNRRAVGAGEQDTVKIAAEEKEIRRLEGDYLKLVSNVSSSGSRLRELVASRPASLADLQQAMKREGFETLTYISHEGQVVLWHISGDAVHARSVVLPREHLMKKVSALRRSLKDPKEKFDEKSARELFLFLIQPALQWIKSDRLVIIPHDDLHYIPFQALIDPANGRALGERFAVSYAPSATVLLRLKKSENLRQGRLLAVADPSIPEARGEVEAIGRLYPNRSRIISDALVKEAELKRMAGGYEILHLSVHGQFVAEEPLLSHLKLGRGENDDGRLTAAEMFGLPLTNARLVTLSACETGQARATRANELIGMAHALLYSGANSLTLSSWKVDAASTALWMETFYREAQTKTPVEAARAALIAVKSDPRYSHPYFWSPFLLIGR